MTAAVIIASVLLALWPAAYIGAAARWPGIIPVPGFIAAWLEELPAPPPLRILDWLTAPIRLSRRPAGQHAAPLSLVFDPLAGRLRDPETGPLTVIPQRYRDYAGKAAEGWWAT
jgi:hypothetical protein